MNDNEEDIPLALSQAEALVLFEFLSRFTDKEQLSVMDQAEKLVLWTLCTQLERQLRQPLAANYEALLQKARAAVRDFKTKAG